MPRRKYSISNGGTAIGFACNSSSACVNAARLAGSMAITISVSRLNWTAPYNTHAWPPISRYRTWRVVRVERTLRIGFGIKRTSHRQVKFPQLHRLAPAFLRREALPGIPFIVGFEHDSPRRSFYRRQAFIPILFRPMMQPCPDLLDDLVRQEARGPRRLRRDDTMR